MSPNHIGVISSQIKEWLADLTISSGYIERNHVYKLTLEDQIVAYYGYYSTDSTEVLLDSMFVSPDYIGSGLGRVLMTDFLVRVKSQGITQVIVYSDPNSKDFYLHFGFVVIGQEPTSIKNRFLPIMSKELN